LAAFGFLFCVGILQFIPPNPQKTMDCGADITFPQNPFDALRAYDFYSMDCVTVGPLSA
tara:strand:- start:556 stop:732 length:177 start_codon:yes stop_codon:yes gene_type:complete